MDARKTEKAGPPMSSAYDFTREPIANTVAFLECAKTGLLHRASARCGRVAGKGVCRAPNGSEEMSFVEVDQSNRDLNDGSKPERRN